MAGEDKRLALQEAMVFLGALASGTEQTIGESAKGISYLAGVNLGKKLSAGVQHTGDIEKALAGVREVLERNGYAWLFETFQPHDRPELILKGEDGDEVMLVFRDCMIRQSLFRFGHAQKGSLCNMMYGFFSGALQNIMGCDSSLEIIHAGENACYKKLVVRRPA